MSWNMNYLPCVENCPYCSSINPLQSAYPQEKLLVSEKRQIEHVSQIDDCALGPSYELSNWCTNKYEMESGLSSYLPVGNSDGIYSSVLSESSHDFEFDSDQQVLDLSADRLQELPESEKFSKTSGHLNVYASEHPFICEKQFDSQNSLTNHNITHLKDRPHACQECGKSFKRSDHLKKHFVTHFNKMNYNCEICQMQFIFKRELTRHMLVHSVEKPYVCEHCGKVFGRKTFLTRHLKLHTDRRNFTCDICSKKFQSKKHLTEHMDVHATEKSHVCECLHCGKSMEANKSQFPSRDRQDKENKTTAIEDRMPLQQKINDSDERNKSFSLTSIDASSFQTPPSDNVEHDISTNFGDGCIGNVFPMSSKLLTAPAVESRLRIPDAGEETVVYELSKASVPFTTQWEEVNYRPNDSDFPCILPDINPDYFFRILQ